MSLNRLRYSFVIIGLLLLTQWVFIDSNSPSNNALAPRFFVQAPAQLYAISGALAIVGGLSLVGGMILLAQATPPELPPSKKRQVRS